MRTLCVGALAAMLLTGCGGGFFFRTPNGTTPLPTGNYVYVVNQTTDTLGEFSLASGVLTSISGSPVALLAGLTPSSVVVTRSNTFVYVGGNGAITCFSIGAGGALSAVNGGGASATANFVSMATSPDGQWLLALDSITLAVYVYKIDATSGALTLNATAAFSAPGSGTIAQRSLTIAPSGAFVAIALGPGGDVLFTFNTSTGLLIPTAGVQVSNGITDNSVLFDSTSAFLFVARYGGTGGTGGVSSYSVGNSGLLTPVQTLAPGGNVPYGLLLDATGMFVYTANRGDGTISGFTVSKGSLTPFPGAPAPSGSAVIALVEDTTKKYVIAAASGGSSDVTLYAFDALSSGKLDAVGVIASGSDPAGSVALAATY